MFNRCLIGFSLALLLGAGSVRGQVLNESFTGASGSTPTGWVFDGVNYTPNLTGPADGGGWLRLTSTGAQQATSAYFDSAFSATGATVYASFDYASWGGNGADGIAFFLFDGSTTFAVGAPGGSLGYAQRNAEAGLAGGYIGVGIDEYGNYSSSAEGKTGGIAFSPDAIAVRGSEASGYAYLGGSGTLATSIDTPSVGTRPASINTVQVLLTATNQLTVTLQQGGINPQTVLQMDLSAYTRPETLKLGFTAGTGGLNNYHEVRNIEASTIAASLWNNQGGSTWGNNLNWSPTVVPTSGSDILFDNTFVSTSQTIDTGANRTVRSVSFDAPFNYTVNNNTLTFDDQGVAGFSGIAATQTRGTGNHAINSNLALNNNIVVRNSSSGSLALGGNIATNAKSVTFDGSGPGGITSSGIISGTGNVIKNDALTATLLGNNTYSGGTTLNAGRLNANHNNALGTGTVALNGGTLGSTTGRTIGNTVALNGSAGLDGINVGGTVTQTGGDYTLGMTNSTISGGLNLSNNNTGRTLTVNAAGANTISGVIANGGTGAGSLTKTGAGSVTLGGANTYTGATTINDGSLILGASNRISDSSHVAIGANGTLNLNGFSERVGNLTASAGGATLDFGTTATNNEFLFNTYTAPASGVFVVNNLGAGDRLATTVASQDVSSVYISGQGVAEQEGSLSSSIAGYANGYKLTAITETYKEWDGSDGDNLWNEKDNWTSKFKPNSNQVALFDFLGRNYPNVLLNGNNTIRGITFGSLSPNGYTISESGSRTLTLSYASGVPFIQQQSANNQVISFSTLRLDGNTVADITGSGNLSISSAITETGGARSLIRDGNGTGKLILSGNNTFSGGTYINKGVVQAKSSGALGTGATVIADTAALELSNSGTISNAMTVTGSGVAGTGGIRNIAGNNTLSGTITQTGDTRIVSDSGALTLGGNLTGANTNTTFAGAGSITANQITTGSGNVIIDNTAVTYAGGNANTYTSTTTLNSGSLTLNKTAGVNAIGTGGLVVNAGTVTLNQNNQIADAAIVTLNNSSTLNLNGKSERVAQLNSASTTSTVALGSGNITVGAAGVNNSTYKGLITGGVGSAFNVNGGGTVYISGNNTGFSGTTNVTAGSLNVSGYNTVMGSGAVNVASGGNLQVQGGLTLSNAMTLNGVGTAANGALENYTGNNTISGNITLGSASRINSAAGALTVAGNIVGLGQNLTVGGAANTTVTGVIGTGGGTLTKDGSGTVTLSGANIYTGATTVSQGTLVARNNTSLGSITGGTSVADGATLQLENNISVGMETLTVTGTGKLRNASGNNTYGGLIQGTGNVQVDGGKLTLTKTNTYTGDTTVANASTLVLAADNALGNGGTTTVASGGTLALQGNIRDANQTNVTIAGTGNGGVGAIQNISGDNTLRSNITLSGNATVTANAGTLNFGKEGTDNPWDGRAINLGANTLTLDTASGANITTRFDINGTGGLTKTGAGTATLNNGWNSYTGATQIDDGKLVLSTYYYSASYPTNYGLTSDVTIGNNVGALKSAIFQMGEDGATDPAEYIRDTQNVTVNSDGYWDLQGFKETINNLTLNGGTIDAQVSPGVVNERLDAVGTITANVGALSATSTINGLLGMNNSATKSIVVGTGATLDIEANLSNGGFVKTGAGTLELSGGNTFTGTAQINEGIVRVNNNAGLGAVGGSTKVTSTNAQLRLENVTIGAEALQLTGSGVSGGGALRSHSGTNTWGGAITLTGNAEIETASGSSLAVNGNISGGGNALTVESIGNTTFNGVNSFGTLNKTGTGTLTVTNTNTYGTANVSAGTFALGASNILSNTMDINVTGTGNFNVGTRTETIDDLVGSGTLTIASGGNLTIDKIGGTLSGGNPVGGFTGTLDVDGIMTLNGGIIGAGANGAGSTGQMILTAGNTLQIASNFTFGTVGTMGGGDQLGSLTLGNGSTLLLSGGSTVNLGALNIDGDSIIDFTAGQANILNLGSLTFTSGSSLTINGWNSYSDLWTSQNFPGATLDIRDDNTAKITFSGFSEDQTIWLTTDYGSKEITVPEPSGYGALFMAFGLASWLLRRRRRA